jgi:hypothetical protein
VTTPEIVVITPGDIVRHAPSYQVAAKMAQAGGRIFVEVTAPIAEPAPYGWGNGYGLSDVPPLKTATRAICGKCGGVSVLTACSGEFWTDCCNWRVE